MADQGRQKASARKTGAKKTTTRKKKAAKKTTGKAARKPASKKVEQPDPSPQVPRDYPDDNNVNGDGFPVVGIGASAGGLEALKSFFTTMPPTSGMAFVVVTHQDPNHKSLLDELLARFTTMPVQRAEEGMNVLPDHVYVIPENKELSLVAGNLHLEEPAAPRGNRKPVDSFLRSLAVDQGDGSIAVILSGTGSDGTLGVKDIKQAGGIVVVQDSLSAKYTGMPESAAATGLVDLEMAPEQMPEMLIELVARMAELARQKADGRADKELASRIERVFQIVDKYTGHDFNNYKLNTLVRRVERRMAVNCFEDLEAYIKFLKGNEKEARALFKDVLIGVTSFFRDPDAFTFLEENVIPRIMSTGDRDVPVRVWVAGCATGEEAYSLAILFKEYMTRHQGSRSVQLFATDIDDEAIAVARQGSYPDSIEVDVNPDRLASYFTKQEGRHVIRPFLREMIVFAQHNLVKDPPFSKLDLICCRNLLIYLTPKIQRQLIPLFHQSLNPEGILFLGSSETVGVHNTLFSILDKKNKIFLRRETAAPVGFDFPMRMEKKAGPAATPALQPVQGQPVDVGQLAARKLLKRYAPPAVVIDENYQVLHFPTQTRQLLGPPVGGPTNDLLKLVPEELRPALRAAVHRVLKDGEPVRYQDIDLGEGEEARVDLSVELLDESSGVQGLVMVIFEPKPAPARPARKKGGRAGSAPDRSAADTMILQLEEQLRINQVQLQSTVEQLESSNEELKSSNEELMSMNEELQSSNEELETSKEELQALNEELVTVNSELQSKVEQLAEANSDMQNLINSSRVATLFLDRNLCIKRFTPAMQEVLNLIEGDIGRPVEHISPRVHYPTFVEDARAVLRNLEGVDQEVQTVDGSSFLVRVLPYRTIEDVIEGVVVTFINITRLKQVEDALRREKALISTMMERTDAMIVYLDPDFNFVAVNRPYAQTCLKKPEELIGRNHFELYPDAENEAIFKQVRDSGESVFYKDKPFVFPDQPDRGVTYWDWQLEPVLNDAGEVIGLVFSLRETTQQFQIMAELRESEMRHRLMGEIIPYGVWLTDAEGRARYISPSWCEMVGRSLDEVKEFGWLDALVPEQRDEVRDLWASSLATGQPFEHEHHFLAADGSRKIVLARGLPIRDENGTITSWAGINLDITVRKRAEEELQDLSRQLEESRKLESLGTLAGGIAHEFNNILTIVMGYATSSMEGLIEFADDTEVPKLRNSLQTIIKTSRRAQSLVKQIMAFGRTAIPVKNPVDVSGVVQEVVDDLQRRGKGDDGTIHMDLAADCVASVDHSQLTQVVSNLLDNALFAISRETGRVDIETGLANLDPGQRKSMGDLPDVPHIFLRIRDNGSGMTAAVKERIFEPFFSTKETGKGTGLGLSVVHSFVEANGGTIVLETEEGSGSSFTLYFPRCFQPVALDSSRSGAATDSRGTGRVLYVEDEPTLVELAEQILSHKGYTVTALTSPTRALAVFSGDPEAFDIVITDQTMPQMTGVELAQKIRQVSAEVPIILCTGYSDQVNDKNFKDLGISHFLHKPIQMTDLAEIIGKLLGKEELEAD